MALANSEIERMGEAGNECKSVVNNTAYMQSHKHLNRMNDMQREVFCGIYYHRKNTAQLANEISLPEDKVRRILKEAFTIIREAKDEN
jgi:DNA-directed RNA polymerase specialized sigma24 family protein